MRTLWKGKPITILFIAIWIVIFILKLNDYLVLTPDRLYQGEIWRIITYALCHFGLLHIFTNVWLMWFIGGIIENQFGSLYILGISVFANLFSGCVALLYLNPTAYMLGSSPGLYALIGFYIVKLLLAKKKITLYLSPITLAILLLVNLLGFDTFMCHLSGFIFGVVIGWIVRKSGTGDL